MDLMQHADEVETQGFTLVPGVIPPEECARLKVRLEETVRLDMEEYGHLPGKKEYLVVDLVTRGQPFLGLLENDKMQALFSHFLGDTCILYSYTSTFLRPQETVPAVSIHFDSPRFIPGYHAGLLMTLALDPFTADNGATWYLPGSQRSEELPSSEEFYAGAVQVTREAGDAVFSNPRVAHAGGHNRTKATRHGLCIYACRSFMRQRFDFPRMVPEELVAQLGARGRSFLGFDVRVPTGLAEFCVPEEKRLYKAAQG